MDDRAGFPLNALVFHKLNGLGIVTNVNDQRGQIQIAFFHTETNDQAWFNVHVLQTQQLLHVVFADANKMVRASSVTDVQRYLEEGQTSIGV